MMPLYWGESRLGEETSAGFAAGAIPGVDSGREDGSTGAARGGKGQERQRTQRHGILPSMALVIDQLPRFSTHEAEKVALELYGIACQAEELPSERDQNFYLEVQSGDGYVLKIANAAEDRDILDAQNKAMEHVAE